MRTNQYMIRFKNNNAQIILIINLCRKLAHTNKEKGIHVSKWHTQER